MLLHSFPTLYIIYQISMFTPPFLTHVQYLCKLSAILAQSTHWYALEGAFTANMREAATQASKPPSGNRKF
jgi:hypothetical protein